MRINPSILFIPHPCHKDEAEWGVTEYEPETGRILGVTVKLFGEKMNEKIAKRYAEERSLGDANTHEDVSSQQNSPHTYFNTKIAA